MSAAMLNYEVKDDKITFKGDLENGEQMAISARTIFKILNNGFAALMAKTAEERIRPAKRQNVLPVIPGPLY
jgi:hypothetical protein